MLGIVTHARAVTWLLSLCERDSTVELLLVQYLFLQQLSPACTARGQYLCFFRPPKAWRAHA
jgi:hypothetical protein